MSYRNKELVLLRDGIPEDVWLDLYYSPVANDDGKPAGVMAMVVETTDHVISERRRRAAEDAYRADNERVRLALNAGALLGSFVWDIKGNVLSGDERFARTFSYPPEQNLADLPTGHCPGTDPSGRPRLATGTGQPIGGNRRTLQRRIPGSACRWQLSVGAGERLLRVQRAGRTIPLCRGC